MKLNRIIKADDVEPCTKLLDTLSNNAVKMQLGEVAEKERVRPDVIVHSFGQQDIVGFARSGFLVACTEAYDNHRHFVLTPDIIYQLVL